MLKVLIVFHCAGDSRAQKIFEPFAQAKDVQLKVIGPQRPWLSKEKLAQSLKGAKYELILGKTFNPPKFLQNKSPFNLVKDWPYKTELFKIIKEFQPDIIQVLSEAFSLPVAQTIFYKNLVSPHSKVFFYAFENMDTSYQILQNSSLGRIYWNYIRKRVYGGTTGNLEAIDILERMGIARKRLRRVFRGIPLDVFYPKEMRELKASLQIDKGFIIGFVGRIVPEKGIDLLISALQSLPEECKLLLVGTGPGLQNLQAECRNLNLESRVIHTVTQKGWQEVANYLNCMDVMVLPSRQNPVWKEQYGRVLAEAMACSVPVIGSSSGAIPEAIGDAGLVFSEDDAEDLTSKIKSIKDDATLRKSLIKKGLSRAKTELSSQAFAKKHLEFYLS